ncbi:c-type cytochrome domain-containing protein [Pontibacter sp. G13]|uniref:c-type cytochrome domain-containing protein n=1 Tax=Pontibacter sp. G13 TaxID=3074898 RepID=UPI00288B8C20|nr:c-type cytochrome domain-containing protein [Pontibacter sp. G13]WNJ17905.1 c-type cytochrome domain-containing protein [Pontibacter sp. G13]
MEGSTLALFFGRFHPVLVHLPIGFLLLAVLLEVAWRLGWVGRSQDAVKFSLMVGTISAAAASLLGWMLSTRGDYNEDMLDSHLWAGIVTTLIAGAAWLLQSGLLPKIQLPKPVYLVLLAGIVVGLTATGHLGGNLTHGSEYLVQYMPFRTPDIDPLDRPPVEELAQAQLFGDIVHPIMKAKCASCHNEEKKKGKLSLASIESYLAGGKHGELFVAGHAGESELIRRVTLPQSDDEFMPPEGKTPLTENEIALLTFWIDTANGSFDTMLVDVKPDEHTLELASAYLKLDGAGPETPQLAEIDPMLLADLRQKGFQIRELAVGSNGLDVVLPAQKTHADQVGEYLEALAPIKANVLWLALEKSGLQDAHMAQLNGFSELRTLKLSGNEITDAGVQQLEVLPMLESLNLYGTQISEQSLDHLANQPKLEKIFIWGTDIEPSTIADLRSTYPDWELVGGI